jgi:hypothetical protein
MYDATILSVRLCFDPYAHVGDNEVLGKKKSADLIECTIQYYRQNLTGGNDVL